MLRPAQPDILWFKEIDKNDGAQVGGKGANLGEMVRAGFPVPDGFVVTAQAYYRFLDANGLREKIAVTLADLDPNDSKQLDALAKKAQKLILNAKMPKDLSENIQKAYAKLGKNVMTAVRSSATAEDLPGASFAGQQATFLNVQGARAVVAHTQKAWASLFEARAVFYRATRGFDHNKVGIAVPIQKMVQSSVSGVMFSLNPVNNDDQVVVVEAIWGLGENIVQGIVTPDHYEVEKGTWEILRIDTVEQKMEMTRRFGSTKNRSTPKSRQKQTKLSKKQMIALAKLAVKLQQHYHYPQDSEWALEDDKLYLVQTRPITTIENIKAQAGAHKEVEKHLALLPTLITGEPASPGIVSGKVRLIKSPSEIHELKTGEIMLTNMTTPDFVPAMKRAAGLITDRGGQTSHAAIVSRELGLPCIVGTGEATKILKDGQIVTINGRTGEVHQGQISRELLRNVKEQEAAVQAARQEQNIKTATKIYVNLAEPELAASVAQRNVDGLGLLRAEFMIAQIGQHPKALIAQGKGKTFTKQLVKGLTQFCEAFGDRPVVYRATDFKTNEYRHLIGGEKYEPQEENPLIGYRGAYRYMTDPRVFELEIEAIKEVRKKHSNLWVMIPFVRSVEEFQRVKKIMFQAGLRRSSSFKIWMMAELPENVIMIDDYIDAGVDGFSIGTNDLTMLILGTDRDNENVASEYDERHPAVQWALERLVRKCRARGVSISVCGQGPSTYHELAEKLVEWGVTSLSVTPDVLELTREIVAEAEAKLVKAKRK